MTREFSPQGIPGPDVAAYYARRAAAGVGLIITEGTYIDHPAAGDSVDVPQLFGNKALVGWRSVVDNFHAAGGAIIPQTVAPVDAALHLPGGTFPPPEFSGEPKP